MFLDMYTSEDGKKSCDNFATKIKIWINYKGKPVSFQFQQG